MLLILLYYTYAVIFVVVVVCLFVLFFVESINVNLNTVIIISLPGSSKHVHY